MAQLGDLPDELISIILRSLSARDQGTLYKLLTVNRRLYVHALPALYRDIWIDARYQELKEPNLAEEERLNLNNDTDDGPVEDVVFWPYYSLIKTLLTDPFKAAFVRSLTIRRLPGHPLRRDFIDLRDLTTGELKNPFAQMTPQQCLDICQTILDVFSNGDGDNEEGQEHNRWLRKQWLRNCINRPESNSLLCLMITRLRNLKFISILGRAERFMDGLLAQLVTALRDTPRATGNVSCLPALETMTIGGLHVNFTTRPSLLLTAVAWADVEMLRAIRMANRSSDPGTTGRIKKLKPGSTSLATIDFRPACQLEGYLLKAVLAVPRALEKFFYHFGRGPSYPTRLGGEDLVKGLSQQQTSLKEVHLWLNDRADLTSCPGWAGLDFSQYEFGALRRLELDRTFLYGCPPREIENHRFRIPFIRGALIEADGFDPSCARLSAWHIPSFVEHFSVVSCHSPVTIQAVVETFDELIQHKDKQWQSLSYLSIACASNRELYCCQQLQTKLALASSKNVTLSVRLSSDDVEEGLTFAPSVCWRKVLNGESIEGLQEEV